MRRPWSRSPALWLAVLRAPAILSAHFYTGDEATYSALATRILHGAIPYVGAVDHKPVGIELTYAAVSVLCGTHALWAVRALAALTSYVTALGLGAITRRLGPSDGAQRSADWATLAYVVVSTFGLASDTQAANTELFLNAPLVLAALFVLPANVRWQPLRAVVAGALVAVAALYKYQAALVGGAFALSVLLDRKHRPHVLSTLAGLLLGFVAAATIYVGAFALAGHLDALAYWGWRFNFAYMSVLTPAKICENAIMYSAVTALLWSPLLIALTAARRQPPWPCFFAWLCAALLAVSAGGRFFPHYYLMALPPMVLLAAPGLDALAQGGGRLRSIALGLTAIATLFSFVCAVGWYWLKPGLRSNTEHYVRVGEYVRAQSSTEDRVFVWGNSPEIYFYSQRVMGTRFPFCNYHTGLIWGSPYYDDGAPGAEAHIVPRAWTELLSDLTAAPPLFIVDAASGGLDHFAGHDVGHYPQLAAVVRSGYVADAVIDGVQIYRRAK